MEDQRYFRDVIRRTRMIYDSLRILSLMEDEKRRQSLSHSLSQSQSQSQNSNPNPSPTPGEDLGDLFFFRMELCLVLGFWGKQKSKKKKKNTKALQQGLRPRLIHAA